MSSQIRVISKVDLKKSDPAIEAASDNDDDSEDSPTMINLSPASRLKHESSAKTFNLIDDRDWNIVSSEPNSETTFFLDGHSAMSIISVIGLKGVGKSTLLNKIANKEAFKTHKNIQATNDEAHLNIKHLTRGIDIHSTHHRMLLDCQPLLAASVLEDFLSGHSNSQFSRNSQISDPMTSCHMISLQLATFLIATSDYVVIMSNWLIDVHLIKLISSAIMMIGENNLRAKFIIYSENNNKIHDKKFRLLIDTALGRNRVDKFFDKESDLLNHIGPYSSEKCELYGKDPTTFTGKNWLTSCQRLWNTTIKNSSMFSDYALQLYSANNVNS